MKRWFQSKSINKPSPAGAVLSYLVLGIWAFLILFPLYWLVITSFKISSQVAEGPFYVPFVDFKPSLDAWKYILIGDLSNDTLRNFTTTVIVAPLSAFLALLIGSTSAYALVRFEYRPRVGAVLTFIGCLMLSIIMVAVDISWQIAFVVSVAVFFLLLQTIGRRFKRSLGNNDIAFWMISQRMLPPVAVVIPIYILFQRLHLLDTYTALILTYVTSNLPIVIWLMRDYIATIPIELEECASIDGASRYRIFRSIVLPLAVPGLVATFLFVLVFTWNEYLLALFLSSAKAQTLPLTIAAQNATRGPQWWNMSVLILIMIVPVIVIAIVLERYITRGLLIGAVKGQQFYMSTDSAPQIVLSALEHRFPPKTDYGIAFIGCGGIINYGHIPSYKASGFNMIGGYDINHEAAEKTAQTHGLKKVYSSIDELLTDPMVEIVDVAVVPEEQWNVVTKVIAAGKPLLCQKPFCVDFAKAVEMASLAQRAGLKMAVHQQFRWSSIIQATRALMNAGWLGNILDVEVQVSIHTPWDMWPWIANQPRLEVLFHSIHYLDSLRYLFGDPALVTSRHTKHPAQMAKGETRTITTWDYSDGKQILIAVCHFDWSPALYSLFRVLGTDGVIEGTIGTNYDYPDGRNDTIKFTSREQPEQNFSTTLPGKWIPDAFYGPMASLMEAIQTDGEPVTSAKDNLGTLRVVEAAYRSMDEARSVNPSEITA